MTLAFAVAIASVGFGFACRPERPESQPIAREGVELWVKESGAEHGKPVMLLHGGPGDTSYVFERSAGASLEKRLRMIYLDQRGAGRSSLVDEDLLGMDDLVLDIEFIRQRLGHEKISFIGHSFGGVLALEYLNRFPERVDRILFIEITTNLVAMGKYQAEYVISGAEDFFSAYRDEISRIKGSELSLMAKYSRVRGLVGKSNNRPLYFPTDESAAKYERWSSDGGIAGRSRNRILSRLNADHYYDSSHDELMKRLSVPAVMFAGRRSHVVGEVLIAEAAKAWGVPVKWFESSGHLPYFDEPDAFSEEAIRFFESLESGIHRTPQSEQSAPK